MTMIPNKMHNSPQPGEILKQQHIAPVEKCSEIFALLDVRGMIASVSSSISPILGHTPDTLVGAQIESLAHPHDVETIRLILSKIAQTPGDSLSAACRLRHQDGSWHHFEGSITNFLHAPGTGTLIASFRSIGEHRLTLPLYGNRKDDFVHFVQFYETDDFLLNVVSNFIWAGLGSGESCIVIATKAHREELEERLKANGLDLAAAYARDAYISLDADEVLSKFMEHDLPVPERFSEIIGKVMAQASQGQKRLRIFGEMVAQFWERDNSTAAIQLEMLWNKLYNAHPSFSLLCAYSMHNFTGEIYKQQFHDICHQHSQVIPDEHYTLLPNLDERLRAIASLQQQANSLENEIMERKEVEARFQHLFDSNLIGVFLSDFDGTFLDANDAFLDLIGYTRAEMLAGTLQRDTLTPPEFQYLSVQAVQALQERGSSGTYEKEYLHKSGRRIPVLIAVTRIEQTNTCIGFVLNISERKELDRRKDEFISMASHELKTPVTSLKGFLGLLQRLLGTEGESGEKGLYYLARMDAQINKLTKLINDLLDLSKIQTGKLVYQEERFDLQALTQEVVENTQGTTQTHHIQLEEVARAEVLGDRDRIGQVLINLLNNAIKYSPQANKILVRMVKDQQTATVSVQDFGIGIAKKHQQKIFERFYQINDAETKTYLGLGIGLHIACEIIQRHGGQMWVESEKGGGATFYFSLPLA
ncbi:MAG TPA: ATP-binding protein [Ktedonosporobacter sp.]|nr:ATP-binding protein [Ktedonosporobacter sp.]